MAFIDSHKQRRTEGLRWGVEPICAVLQFAPSTYYDAKSRPPSRRSVSDAALKVEIRRVWDANWGVYGADKLWRSLHRGGVSCGRDRVARLMREMGIEGVVRAKQPPRTTQAAEAAARPVDLVERDFTAEGPNRLWVADLTYVGVDGGWVYTAFVTDVFARRILGWKVSSSLRADLAVDALSMATWARHGQDLSKLVHHSDRGVQYLSVRYTARLEAAGAVASVGSRGDSYDNALAETINGLYKAELIHRRRWANRDEVEAATSEWVWWWNHQRLHGAIGFVPPAEYEAAHAARVADQPADGERAA